MVTASAYTNKRRVMAEAGNLKVDQIGNVATNFQRLQPVLPSTPTTGCVPDYTSRVYFKGCKVVPKIPIIICETSIEQ